MNEIKEYLVAVTICTVIGAIADIITSFLSEKHPDIAKTVSLGLTICILSAILLPVLKEPFSNANDNFTAAFDYKTGNAESDTARFLEKEVELEVQEYVYEKTGIKPTLVRIEIAVKDDSIEVIDAEVMLGSESAGCEQNIIEAAQEALGREVRIIYAD